MRQNKRNTAIDARGSVNEAAATNPPRVKDTPLDESAIDADAVAKTKEGEGTAADSQGRVNEVDADGLRSKKENDTDEAIVRKATATAAGEAAKFDESQRHHLIRPPSKEMQSPKGSSRGRDPQVGPVAPSRVPRPDPSPEKDMLRKHDPGQADPPVDCRPPTRKSTGTCTKLVQATTACRGTVHGSWDPDRRDLFDSCARVEGVCV